MIEDDPQRIEHIDIGKETDLFLVAPASANTIAKLAMGLADNMVTSTALALPQRTKKLLAPAMNTKMLDHPATQRKSKTLTRLWLPDYPTFVMLFLHVGTKVQEL